MLRVSKLSCSRGNKPLFGDVSFELKAGQALHLEGDNGVGKTSLLRIVCGLSLKEELSALENLMSDAAVAGRTLSEAQALVALARMGLRGREHLPLRVMSQGQKRRTALARLLASQAPLWVLDEPFVALDVKAVDGLRGLMAEHVANGGMVLFTSHQPVALTIASGTLVDVQTYRLRGTA